MRDNTYLFEDRNVFLKLIGRQITLIEGVHVDYITGCFMCFFLLYFVTHIPVAS